MREFLLSAFQAALNAANPQLLVPPNLPAMPRGRTLVVGGGKAAAAMAKAVEDHWPSVSPLSGLVVTRYRHSLPLRRIEVVEASHPLPDGRGVGAARRMLSEICALTPDDLLLVLLSGGGSSLLALPVEGVTLKELRTLTKALLACGAAIQEINSVRKHLTLFSGGRLAQLSHAPVITLIISDVVGNNPTHIASGPCAPDPTTYADAQSILDKYGIASPPSVAAHLSQGLAGEIQDTPKPGDKSFAKVENLVIGSARDSLNTAKSFLEHEGMEVLNLGEIEGESRWIAAEHAAWIHNAAMSGKRHYAFLSGGETTVRVSNPSGHGGRNTEYLLAMGAALGAINTVHAIACDTDGIDGTEDNAGAIWTADSLQRASLLGLDINQLLDNNNAYEFFRAMNDLVVTGPTRTNVNDFRLIMID